MTLAFDFKGVFFTPYNTCAQSCANCRLKAVKVMAVQRKSCKTQKHCSWPWSWMYACNYSKNYRCFPHLNYSTHKVWKHSPKTIRVIAAQSKCERTDRLRDGQTYVNERTNSPSCPFSLKILYAALAAAINYTLLKMQNYQCP